MKKAKITTEDFVEKSNKIHNNKYIYNLSNYTGRRNYLIIICLIHGQFKQTAGNHLNGRGCPRCANVARITLQDAQNLAKSRGGILLSDSIKNSTSSLKWECSKKHIFYKPYSEVNRRGGNWCNLCSLPWKSEEICRIYFETIFEKKFIKCRPNWLINKYGFKLELDGFCEELKLAFEHNGEQHISINSIFSKNNLDRNKENDIEKIEICNKYGINLIVIPQLYRKTKIEELEKIVKSLAKQFNIKVKENYIYDFSHLNTSIFSADRFSLMIEAAVKNEGKCLSNEYLTNRSMYKFECKFGHIWEMRFDQLKLGNWCPVCGFIINKLKLSKEEIENIFIKNNKNITKISKQLKISRDSFISLLRKFEIK